MQAISCSSRHFTHFAIYRIIFGVGNFSRGFFVCSERKCSIFVSVLLSGDAHARRPLHKMDGVFFFFFVLSVSCWNIRFGVICHFRPTNSSSSTENLRIVFTYFAKFKSSRPFSRLHLVDF